MTGWVIANCDIGFGLTIGILAAIPVAIFIVIAERQRMRENKK
jgi:hypothetical protein